MDLGIAAKRALVTASSKGLGRGCAEALAAAGVDLVMNARGKAALEETAEAIRAAHGVSVTVVAADVTRPEGRAEVLEERARWTFSSPTPKGRHRGCAPTGSATISSPRWIPTC